MTEMASDPDEPTVSADHTAVWTGTEMIVWGGGTVTNYGAATAPGTTAIRRESVVVNR